MHWLSIARSAQAAFLPAIRLFPYLYAANHRFVAIIGAVEGVGTTSSYCAHRLGWYSQALPIIRNADTLNLDTLLNLLQLGEDQEVEFKSAAGGLPRSLWESLSAMANSEGGWLVLGVAERRGVFTLEPLRNTSAMLKTFWDTHNNPGKLSTPLCRDSDVSRVSIEGGEVLVIQVPRANRQQRPVFINGNPLTGSYKRNHEGDYRCTEAEVRQMLRDASDEAQDYQVLSGFNRSDLDDVTLAAFRNRFSSRDPDHPFLAQDEQTFLESLGAWRRDRQSGQEGITLAGLLMFGKERSLLDALPHYHLDYQEQLSDDPDVRWTYRLTLDGKWVPNLFNFYYGVFPRLSKDLDVPFKTDQLGTRREETHVHQALREALVNSLIHADHHSTRPITVIRRRDAFIFRNPGLLRVPRDQLYQGGVSDPRNPNLLKVFQLLGLGERAGSGFQRIVRAWREQNWVVPLVSEEVGLEMTEVNLPLVSMIPMDVERALRGLVGDAYPALDELSRTVLIMAYSFGEVRNVDLQAQRDEHPRVIGEHLSQLTSAGWLIKQGHGKGTRYRWPDTPQDLLTDADTHLPPTTPVTGGEVTGVVTGEVTGEVKKLLQVLQGEMSRSELQDSLGLKHEDHFRNAYLRPGLDAGLIAMTIPDKPRSRLQKYRLTVEGRAVLNTTKKRD